MLFISFLILSNVGFSQSELVKTSFYIKSPENKVFIYVNDSLLIKDIGYGESTMLKPGEYKGLVWAQYCRKDSINFIVHNEKVNVIRAQLNFSNNYLNYLKSKKERKAKIMVSTLSVGSTAFGLINFLKLRKSNKRFSELEMEYETSNSPTEISNIRMEYDDVYSKMPKQRIMGTSGTIIGIVSTILTLRIFKQSNSNLKPELVKEANPFAEYE